MRAMVEDVFLDWQKELAPSIADLVEYEDFDTGIMTVFVYRHEDFARDHLKALEAMLKQKVHSSILVSSIVETDTGS